MRRKSVLWAVGLCLLLALPLSGCGDKNAAPQPPEAYVLGADSAPPLDAQLTEGGALVSAESFAADGTPIEAGKEDKKEKEDKKDEEDPDAVDGENPDAADGENLSADPETPVAARLIYTYAELPVGGTMAETYAGVLSAAEQGFQSVDEENVPAQAPDYSAQTGTALLARTSTAEGKLFRIRLDWTETSCAVTVDQPEGTLPQESAELGSKPEPMTLSETVRYMNDMAPSDLGLEGETMSEYHIYPADGVVMVDDRTCKEFRVYRRTEQNTNAVAGIYLVGDERHIYRLDSAAGTVESVT